MTTPNQPDPRIQQLEAQYKKLVEEVLHMRQRMSYLERENTRRKVEVSNMNRKG